MKKTIMASALMLAFAGLSFGQLQVPQTKKQEKKEATKPAAEHKSAKKTSHTHHHSVKPKQKN